ncbi:MATE family efflux transporter [[Clostridium] polysaccharolyticum]|uniref:Multidrug export protein MepA n=1 Tax=[Clostridium] polysaccharolyticum TaxID=29364 RepID=A0A1I0DRB1_9FIRM|nr:MATE family efflux transporter [[Clostridium] polysaccharolyticum]SET34934.1 Na+-driven multidrug efflux pump [[Clostridium] polysaccharolyticum]
MEEKIKSNPLGIDPVKKLLGQFAIPSIIAMLVSALYNIVDQFFIGNSVGDLGNAATNIAFPLSISCIAISLMFGIGGASAFNLTLGHGDKEKAGYFIGNAVVMMFGLGILLTIISELFLTSMLRFFGSPENVLHYAETYTRITAAGFPFLIVATGGGHLVRADGSPRFTMISNMTGAVINTILDAVFVFGLKWGMAGAAYATIIGQIVSFFMVIWYMRHFKTVKIEKRHLGIHWDCIGQVVSLGAAPFSNQVAMMVVQIVMNNSLKHYGSLSSYGESIPIACAGIISKVGMVFFSFIIGISQGLQPIVSFNYGAGKYSRVKEAYRTAVTYGLVLSIVAFALFQIFPRNIIAVFGNGTEEYFRFAVNYFRIFMFFTFINFVQPITSNFFTAIGKPGRGIFLSLTRQIIFLLPLIIIFPLFIGIDGIMYAGPVADCLAAVVCITMVVNEFRGKEYKLLH